MHEIIAGGGVRNSEKRMSWNNIRMPCLVKLGIMYDKGNLELYKNITLEIRAELKILTREVMK